MYATYGQNIHIMTMWQSVNSSMAKMGVEGALKNIDLILALLPISVEKIFSQMMLIKTDKRHSSFMIRLNNPSIEDFDLDNAISLWVVSSNGQRRLSYRGKAIPEKIEQRQNQDDKDSSSSAEEEEENQHDDDNLEMNLLIKYRLLKLSHSKWS